MNVNNLNRPAPSSLPELYSVSAEIIREQTTPFRGAAIAGFSGFALFNIGLSIKNAVQIKGRFKAVPLLNIFSSIGDLMGEVGKSLVLVSQKLPHLVKVLTTASTALGASAIALQVFGLASNIWESVSIHKQIKEFNRLRREDPAAALKSICSKQGERKIFRVINKKQSQLIKSILLKEHPQSVRVNLAAKAIKKQLRTARILQIIKTAINILMVLGLVLLFVTPTPATPIILTTMMIGMGLSFGSRIASFFSRRSCLKSLNKLNPSVAS